MSRASLCILQKENGIPLEDEREREELSDAALESLLLLWHVWPDYGITACILRLLPDYGCAGHVLNFKQIFRPRYGCPSSRKFSFNRSRPVRRRNGVAEERPGSLWAFSATD